MLENNISRADALRYAFQIDSTNLALQDPLGQENEHLRPPLGQDKQEDISRLPESYRGRSLSSIVLKLAERPSGWRVFDMAEDASIRGMDELPELDLIIINPPSTRTNSFFRGMFWINNSLKFLSI